MLQLIATNNLNKTIITTTIITIRIIIIANNKINILNINTVAYENVINKRIVIKQLRKVLSLLFYELTHHLKLHHHQHHLPPYQQTRIYIMVLLDKYHHPMSTITTITNNNPNNISITIKHYPHLRAGNI